LDGQINGATSRDVLEEQLGLEKGTPLDLRKVMAAIFALDPVSLLHGVFFAQGTWPWQPKVARAVTAFIEAEQVEAAVSGGVKKDSVNNNAAEGRGSSEGYGMVPHHRVEYTAGAIRLYVVIDNQQLASYGLSPAATELLSALADWELATLLDGGLRLRTACDLVIDESSDAPIPSLQVARDRLAAATDAARGELGSVTEVVWIDSPKGKAK
jgi:CRISPR-associated protein Csb1